MSDKLKKNIKNVDLKKTTGQTVEERKEEKKKKNQKKRDAQRKKEEAINFGKETLAIFEVKREKKGEPDLNKWRYKLYRLKTKTKGKDVIEGAINRSKNELIQPIESDYEFADGSFGKFVLMHYSDFKIYSFLENSNQITSLEKYNEKVRKLMSEKIAQFDKLILNYIAGNLIIHPITKTPWKYVGQYRRAKVLNDLLNNDYIKSKMKPYYNAISNSLINDLKYKSNFTPEFKKTTMSTPLQFGELKYKDFKKIVDFVNYAKNEEDLKGTISFATVNVKGNGTFVNTFYVSDNEESRFIYSDENYKTYVYKGNGKGKGGTRMELEFKSLSGDKIKDKKEMKFNTTLKNFIKVTHKGIVGSAPFDLDKFKPESNYLPAYVHISHKSNEIAYFVIPIVVNTNYIKEFEVPERKFKFIESPKSFFVVNDKSIITFELGEISNVVKNQIDDFNFKEKEFKNLNKRYLTSLYDKSDGKINIKTQQIINVYGKGYKDKMGYNILASVQKMFAFRIPDNNWNAVSDLSTLFYTILQNISNEKSNIEIKVDDYKYLTNIDSIRKELIKGTEIDKQTKGDQRIPVLISIKISNNNFKIMRKLFPSFRRYMGNKVTNGHYNRIGNYVLKLIKDDTTRNMYAQAITTILAHIIRFSKLKLFKDFMGINSIKFIIPKIKKKQPLIKMGE